MNNKFEKLLSKDPIGAFDKIKSDYIRYFENAYRIVRDDKDDKGLSRIDKERVALLDKDDNLYKTPYLELLPEYAQVTDVQNVDGLIGKFADEFGSKELSEQFFNNLVKNGLMPWMDDVHLPHGHQVGMMEKSFIGVKRPGAKYPLYNTVITSGTGSGKTESFLLPLMADIFKEAKNWGEPNYRPTWYEYRTQDGGYVANQRTGENRDSAMRALILYPMNALVEDQMARLRRALDSDEVRDFMDSQDGLNGNRIFFGGYNGSTIGTKSHKQIEEFAKDQDMPRILTNKEQELAEKLDKKVNRYHSICDYYYQELDDNGRKEKEDALFVSPRLGGWRQREVKDQMTAEMVTRWDMQTWAPDIMITNVSMLSIMLMRKAEENIIEQTKAWLEKDKTHVFHIVVDELHLYRDTAGSETACLIRQLFDALGLKPVIPDVQGHLIPNPQIRVLASSASLGSDADTEKFLEEFFGIYSTDPNNPEAFNVQHGTDYNTDADPTLFDAYTTFKAFSPDSFVFEEDEQKIKFLNDFVQQFDCGDIFEFIRKYQEPIFARFKDLLAKPISLDVLCQNLFGGNKDAMRGFFIFRASIDKLRGADNKKIEHRLPRFRFHVFYKYIEGLWGELQPSLSNIVDPVNHLSCMPKELGPDRHKVLELLRCENCGQLFIGGNRKEENGRSFMTINYPSLDQIPNFNPTPMVQYKSFEDYVLFWPQVLERHPDVIDLESDNKHVSLLSSRHTEFTETHGRAEWRRCYLNVTTGELTSTPTNSCIEGYQLKIRHDGGVPDLSTIHALPCSCPHCKQNYKDRTYTKSPIRSFRTGIDRSNQVLSKELLYQLTGENAKLIGFSDSREDAAKQALGIGMEHYRDMVRMLFMECIKEMTPDLESMRMMIEYGKNNGEKRAVTKSNFRMNFSTQPNVEDYFDALYDEDIESLENLLAHANIVEIQSLIGRGFDGSLIKKMVKLGINPAGDEYKFYYYTPDGTNTQKHWSEGYDIQNGILDPYGDTPLGYRTNITAELESAIFANSFGKYMGVSTLDSGMGYICCRRDLKGNDLVNFNALTELLPAGIDTFDFLDACIRVMGDDFRYQSNEGYNQVDYTEWDNIMNSNIAKPFRKLLEKNPDIKIDKIFRHVNALVGSGIYKLNFNNLAFRKLDKSDRYWKCPRCGRVHPNLGFGFCTNTCCMKDLNHDPEPTPVESLYKKYISFDIMEEPKNPRRLHTEELTGQTDNIQDRLLEFKDLILIDNDAKKPFRENYERTKAIDMVCVTTTMEVGVDIGSLEAIYQGNMPPTRYNYQQRVGRGGRRGQAFSVAFTFCRGRSHDTYYYKKATDEIVGSIPPAPRLALAPYEDKDEHGNAIWRMKLSILKRVVVKTILKYAFRGVNQDYRLNDTAGEFGYVYDWETNKPKLKEILNSSTYIDGVLSLFFDQFNKNGQIQNDIKELKNWLNEHLVDEIDTKVDQCPNPGIGLAQYLSECGFMPMYGLPSDSRDFYHGYNPDPDEDPNKKIRTISRSSEIAISEFAPGAEKTKDKGTYRVEAISTAMHYGDGGIRYYDRDKDALADRYVILYDGEIANGALIQDIIPARKDGEGRFSAIQGNERFVVIPQAYRSLKLEGNVGKPIENTDRRSNFNQSEIFAKTDGNSHSSILLGNVKLSAYGQGVSDDAQVWHVNSRNRKFYCGKYDSDIPSHGCGDKSEFVFYQQINGNRKDHELEPVPESQNSLSIALGAKKSTEIVKLSLLSCPDVLNLTDGNKSAVDAAFFSAAFLIQRVLADRLDVQPDEIEISLQYERNELYPQIYLSDALPNGAGIVSYLQNKDKLKSIIDDIINFKTSYMQYLKSEDHRHECLTACPNCLQTYSNRGYHHILDWRMGVGILRLMDDPTYDFGFDQKNCDKYDELKDQQDLLKIAANLLNLENFDPKQLYVKESRQGRILYSFVYHPLWNQSKLLTKIDIDGNGNNVKMYNIFRVLRGDYKEDVKHLRKAPVEIPPANPENPANMSNDGKIIGGIEL